MEQGKHSVQSKWAAAGAGKHKLRTHSFGKHESRSDGRALDGQAKLLLAVQGLLGIANAFIWNVLAGLSLESQSVSWL